MTELVTILLAILAAITTPALPDTATSSVPYEDELTYQGIASQGAASHGRDYLAMREPRGTVARLCGMGGCWTGTVNDYGPSKRIYPERVADIGIYHWVHVCGLDPKLGVCPVTVTILSHERIPLPATDMEDGS